MTRHRSRPWLASVVLGYACFAAACGGGGDGPEETPGLSGISFHVEADAAQNLHAVYRGYAEGDGRQPQHWERVYYRRY
jgi:hypothetical protein